jgi:hypothetical protein
MIMPKALTEQETKDLIPLIRAGDKSAINKAIEGHMRLVLHIFGGACERRSKVLSILVHAVNIFPLQKENDNLVAYILNTITLALQKNSIADGLIAGNQYAPALTLEPLVADPSVCSYPDEALICSELFSTVTESAYEESILRELVDGYNFREIAEIMGINLTEVYNICTLIRIRTLLNMRK